jgi:leucyl aminopeptidase
MEFQIVSSSGKRKVADAIVLPYWEGKKKPTSASTEEILEKGFLSLVESDFTAKAGEILFSYHDKLPEKRVIFLGLGEKKEADKEQLRKAAALLTQFCIKKKISSLNFFVPEEADKEQLQAILDGFSMANYSFDALKRESLKDNSSTLLKKVFLFGVKKEMQSAIDRHHKLMESVNLVRDLVNGNADDVQAQSLALLAKDLAKKFPSIQCKVLGQKELEKEKMGLMLAVNRGADQDPCCIILSYFGDPSSKDLTALVGKGITYDTGGLNLKPTGSIETMRVDMAGAAAVLGTMQVIASLKLKKNVIGVIAAAENAIGPKSYKPGDVYISHSGKSVEISNTDAEGRLVLADAFSYIQTYYSPTRIIDLATLTGGIVVAIGEEASGLFSNEKKLVEKLQLAAEVTGEKVWQMPLFPEYRKALKSVTADIKNAAAGRKASPCTAAVFLQQFIHKGVSWAHLDIAGTAYISEVNPYYPSFATGVGVKLLTVFLEKL